MASVIGGFFSFGLGWANGANDIANSFGTAVGSKTLNVRTAVVVGAIFEFLGAVLTGASVSKTISKGIVDADLFDAHGRGPQMFQAAMLSVLIGTFTWTFLATFLKLPVSITHGVVGSLIATGLLALGPQAILGQKVLLVCISWVTSPLLGGIVSALLWLITKKLCHSQTPEVSLKNIQMWVPAYFFVTFTILMFFITKKGPPEIKSALKNTPILMNIIPFIAGLLGAVIARPLTRKVIENELKNKKNKDNERPVNSSVVQMVPRNKSSSIDERTPTTQQSAKTDINDSSDRLTNGDGGATAEEGSLAVDGKKEVIVDIVEQDSHYETERYFLALLTISSCVVAFSHGGNDVANAIGPFGAILEIAKSGSIQSKPDVPIWLVLLGGAAFAIGILMWGYRVVETVGNGLTHLTVSRAFCAQLGAGISVMSASSLGMPISTSHTIVGSVIFVAIADKSEVQWTLMKKIFGSWVITIPCAASVSAISFIIIDWINLKNE